MLDVLVEVMRAMEPVQNTTTLREMGVCGVFDFPLPGSSGFPSQSSSESF